MKIIIPIQLQKLIGAKEIDGEWPNVYDLLMNLCADHHGLTERLYGKEGKLNKFVCIFVNDEDIRFLNGESTELKKDDIISIIPSIAGG